MIFYLMTLLHLLLLILHCLEGGQFPCTDDCQVTFVNLKCDSSKKRRRGRKSPSKEVSHITAEFEMEMKEEEASGVMFFLTYTGNNKNTINAKRITRGYLHTVCICYKSLRYDFIPYSHTYVCSM